MTEKRYIEGVKCFDDYDAWDNKTEQGLSHSEVVNELNRLSEKNEELKTELQNKTERLFCEIEMKMKYHSKLIDSEKENEQLKEKNKKINERNLCLNSELSYYRSQYWKIIRYKQLEEENEQLKSTNMEMEDYLARLEESKINLQIKLQKIRDYAKEDGEIKQGIIEKVILE